MPLQNTNRHAISMELRASLGSLHSVSGGTPFEDELEELTTESSKTPATNAENALLRTLVHTYTQSRTKDKASVTELQPRDIALLAKAARQFRLPNLLDNLAGDILEYVPAPRCRNFVSSLLTAHNCPHFRPSTLVALFRSLPTSMHSTLTMDIVAEVALAVLQADPPDCKELSYRLVSTLCRGIDAHQQRRLPSAVIGSLFSYIIQLAKANQEPHALTIFQSLVDAQYIPPEAIRHVDMSTQNFQFIVTSALVRSCLFWHWRSKAVLFLRGLLKTQGALDPPTFDLFNDTLYAMLEFPTHVDLTLCFTLVNDLAYHRVGTFVSHGLIRQLYDVAARLHRSSAAAQFYAAMRRKTILSQHEYPPPNGAALPWLLHHLTTIKKDAHLGRTLIKQVVRSGEPISPRDRAPVIALAAEHGYATQARTLYERYSVGKHRALVVGNAALVVRMSSLYGSLIRRLSSSLGLPIMEQELEASGPSSPQREHSEDDPETQEEDDDQVREILEDRDAEQKQLDDLVTFSKCVLDNYRETLEPLGEASHHSLNALARSNFLLGNVAVGFDAFQVLLDRLEIPDAHDVSVALSVMAQYNCRSAVRMMRRMIVRGIVPDNVTFGTVIHHALLKKDTQIIGQLFELVRMLGQQLTHKTMTSLIRASIILSRGDPAALKENLQLCVSVIEANLEAPHLPSPNMGKFCAIEALRADEPVLAFRFWRLVVKEKAEWNDREQRALRSSIAKTIRRHHADAMLGGDEAQGMLSELKQ